MIFFPRGGARENKVDQYVFGCQISMDHQMLVQMCQAVQALQAQRLGKPCGLVVAAAADGAANELVQVAICQRKCQHCPRTDGVHADDESETLPTTIEICARDNNTQQ